MKISLKKKDNFNMFAQNIDCGYMLEHVYEYPQPIFVNKNKKKVSISLLTPVLLNKRGTMGYTFQMQSFLMQFINILHLLALAFRKHAHAEIS